MSNCIECGATNPPTRGNRKRKYCSKKCANDFHHKKNRVSVAKPGYGDKSREEKRLKEERRKEYELAMEEGWVCADDLARDMGLHKSSILARSRKHLQEGLETKMLVLPNGSQVRYFHPDALEKLKNPNPIPEGYLTSKQAAEYLGYCYHTFSEYSMGKINPRDRSFRIKRLEPSLKALINGRHAYLYTTDDLDAFKKRILEFRSSRAEIKALKRQKRKAEEEAIKLEKERAYQEAAKNLILVDEAIKIFGSKSVGPIQRMQREGLLSCQIIRGRRWYDPKEVKKCAKIWQEERRLRKENATGRLPDWRFRKDGLEQWERRELRARNYIPRDADPKPVESNKMYWRCHDEGVIHKKTCCKCGEAKPYYMFYLSWKRDASGRSSRCVPCNKLNQKPKKWNNKKESPDKKLRRIFGVTIKRHLSRIKKTYVSDLTQGYIWQKLEENCGYDEKKLVEHIESQFTPEMNWDNYGQLGTSISRDKFCWNIDHIKPKSSFRYETLNDKEFIECWSLDNLRPLDARINAIKGGSASEGASGYRGVKKASSTTRPWSASISINGKQAYLGSFPTAEEAARAYDRKAKEEWGEFAYLNFPDEV